MFTGIPYMDRTIFNSFSQAEQAYAISLLDPFHDTPYRLTGAPSDQLGQSVVLTINQEKVVGAGDFGLPVTSGSKWDLHVTALPLARQANAYATLHQETNKFVGSSSGSESLYDTIFPCSFAANVTGGNTFVGGNDIQGIGTDLAYYTSNSGAAWQDARCYRIIGQSFEVVDETPQLYKQGSVTVYTRNSCNNLPLLNCWFVPEGGTTLVGKTARFDQFLAPPTSIQQATIIPDSKTWMAQEGAYVVAKPTTLCPPFERPGISNWAMVGPTDPANSAVMNSWFAREGLNSLQTVGTTSYTNDVTFVTPYNVSGAYFTGLNAEFGVYRIRSKINIEIIPDPTDTALISQATPTIPRNPVFETLLFKSIGSLPAGWPQTSNPAGEVWRKVVKTIGMISQGIAPTVAGASGVLGPQAPLLGEGLGMTGGYLVKWADNRERAAKNKKIQRQKQKLEQLRLANAAQAQALVQSTGGTGDIIYLPVNNTKQASKKKGKKTN